MQTGTPPQAEPTHSQGGRKPLSLLLTLLVILFAVILVRRAWLCDDAFITFRTVDNLFHGYRLTWNVMERVQSFTHPLWMLLLSLLYLFTRELYYTTLVLCLGLSIAAVGLLNRRLAASEIAASLGLFALMLSRAYVDYATSGLENPLSHLLIVIFFIQYFNRPASVRGLFWLSLTASLGILNRMDTALVFLPALLVSFWQVRGKRAFWLLLAGQAPFLLWELFATWYYGFPFPNTAYAKLNTGIASGEYIQQGMLYLLNSLETDPITLTTICIGLALSFTLKNKKSLALSLGAALYLLYIVKVGGDFMSGRFLTIPLLCAVLLLVRADFTRLPVGALAGVYLALLALGMSVTNPTLRINDLGPKESGPIHVGDNGILDERMLYYGGTGLLTTLRDQPQPNFYWAVDGETARDEGKVVVDKTGIGMFGYYAGPSVYVLDRLALADPLLARLPAKRAVNWRIGHFERQIPKGYVQTLTLKRNSLDDPNLALFYDKLSILTKGSLFSGQRLVEIWKMNTGQYKNLIDYNAYRYPGMARASLDELQTGVENMTPCGTAGLTPLSDSGIEIDLQTRSSAPWLEISLDHNDRYEVVYYQGEEELARQILPTAYLPEPGGVSVRMAAVPALAAAQGYDRLRVFPNWGDGSYCLAYLRPREN